VFSQLENAKNAYIDFIFYRGCRGRQLSVGYADAC
jgi:hypothetical protein